MAKKKTFPKAILLIPAIILLALGAKYLYFNVTPPGLVGSSHYQNLLGEKTNCVVTPSQPNSCLSLPCFANICFISQSKISPESTSLTQPGSTLVSNDLISPSKTYIVKESILGDYNTISISTYKGRTISKDLIKANSEAIGYNTKIKCQCGTSFKGWVDNSHFAIKVTNGGGEEYEFIVNAETGKVEENSFKRIK